MTRLLLVSALQLLVVLLLAGGCEGEAPATPTAAQHTYGDTIDATNAIPGPAVAAEPGRYLDRRVTVDGRIADVTRNGCTLHLATDGGPPLRVDASRTEAAPCTWQVPAGTDGVAVTTGTLRADRDTLRLSADGVQITPLRPSK